MLYVGINQIQITSCTQGIGTAPRVDSHCRANAHAYTDRTLHYSIVKATRGVLLTCLKLTKIKHEIWICSSLFLFPHAYLENCRAHTLAALLL